jgi:hypothetical protein
MPSENVATIQIARTVDEVSALRTAWQELQWHPNADIDYYLTVLSSRSEVFRPHVIVLNRGGIPQSMLVGRLESRLFDVRLGYKRLPLSTVRCLTFIYGGLLGNDSEENVLALIGSVMGSLKSQEAEMAWFNQLRVDSAAYRLARETVGSLSRDYFPVMNQHWKARLPNTYDAFYRSRSGNTRHNLKRYSKRLQETFRDQLTIKSFRKPCEIEQILADTEVIETKSYHRGLQVGFVNNAETHRLMMLAANRQWLRAYILYIGEKPVAFWNGLLYQGTFFTGTTGFDPAYGDFRPGVFLLQRMFEDLCQNNAAVAVDFGFGDAQYKRDWCDENWEEASLFVFAPTFRGGLLNTLRTPLMAVSHAAQRVLIRTQLLQRVKKLWRNQLTVRPGAGEAKK